MSKHYTCVLSAQHGVFCATLGPFSPCQNFLPAVVHHSIPLVMLDFNSAQFHRFCLDSETIANEKHLNLPFSHWKFSLGKSQEISRSHGNFLLFLPHQFSRKSLSLSRNLKVSDFAGRLYDSTPSPRALPAHDAVDWRGRHETPML